MPVQCMIERNDVRRSSAILAYQGSTLQLNHGTTPVLRVAVRKTGEQGTDAVNSTEALADITVSPEQDQQSNPKANPNADAKAPADASSQTGSQTTDQERRTFWQRVF